MPELVYIAGIGEMPRETMITFVNIGSATTRNWEAVGVKIEESSLEYNPDIEKVTDILGLTHTTFNKTEPQQSFEPHTLRKESKLAEKLDDIMYRRAYTELQQFEVMIAYAYAGAEGAFSAELHSNCTIEVTSKGGSRRVELPFNVHFSNDITYGTVNQLGPVAGLVFTEN